MIGSLFKDLQPISNKEDRDSLTGDDLSYDADTDDALLTALPVVQKAISLKPRPQVVWMQLTVRNDEAAALAEANGMKVVMNRCPKIEYGRLSSEISWMGVNSRTLSAKRAPLLGKGIQRMSLQRETTTGGATEATMRAERDREN